MASPTFSLASTIPLHIKNTSVSMPLIHLGVYMTTGTSTSSATQHALNAGYRAFDSAEWYANEQEVGSAILAYLKTHPKLTRADIWFTTKLKSNVGYEATRRSIKESVRVSGLGYLDLYLLHSPYGGAAKRLECWRAVEDAMEGEVRVGGVSNFGVKHLQELLDAKPKLTPAVNQIEVHPFNTQSSITSFCRSKNIVVQAYAPLARALRFRNPTITRLSKKYNCTPAQLFVRWSLQMGYVPLPKSVKKERIIGNADIGEFKIDDDDMKILEGCDEHLVTDWDPTDAD